VDYIEANKEEFGVEPICSVLQVAPSTYYAHRSRPPSAQPCLIEAAAAMNAHVVLMSVLGRHRRTRWSCSG